MKNQTARFTSETDATLVLSLSKGKKEIKLTPRLKDGADAKTKVGKKQYFDLNEAGEKAAQTAFDAAVEKAKGKGWALASRAVRTGGFEDIPDAPKKGTNGGATAAKGGTPPAAAKK